MQKSFRAPELSATSRIVPIWIMADLLGLSPTASDDVLHAPALLGGERTRLLDLDDVADLAVVHAVVREEASRALLEAAVAGMLDEARHLDDHRLLHLVGDDGADLPRAARGGLRGRRCLRVGGGAHLLFPLLDGLRVLHELRRARRGLQARAVPPHLADLHRVLELAGRLLEADREHGLRPLLLLRHPLLGRPLRHLLVRRRLLRHQRTASRNARETKRVLIPILSAASWNASRAVFSSTPSISKSTRAGFTTATQPSGAPFPLPMRVSAGFLVIGLSGKTRIQSFPPPFTWRRIATRPASIWRAVSQPGASATIPDSPDESSDTR